jgi:hypothetical protein
VCATLHRQKICICFSRIFCNAGIVQVLCAAGAAVGVCGARWRTIAIDITARVVAQTMGEKWGRTFVVDNRPGARGVIALDLTQLNLSPIPTRHSGASRNPVRNSEPKDQI